MVRAALSAAAGHQFRSARHPDFRAALEPLVAVDWLESNSATDGVRTFTPGVHVVRLAWGRMTYIGIYPDTVVTTLQRLSRAGVAEATTEKIEG